MRLLYEKAGISTILVAGSSGAFFSQADTIIQMNQYGFARSFHSKNRRKVLPFLSVRRRTEGIRAPAVTSGKSGGV